MVDSPKRALVLSGGGARGAYEAGVLAYIFRELPEHLVAKGRLSLLCGTSVGALHACFLASTAHLPHNHIDAMLAVWQKLKLRELLRLTPMDLLRMPADARALWRNSRELEGVLLDVPLLQDLVTRDIAWPQIHENMRTGHIEGLTVSTTHIASGRTVVFIERPDGGLPPWTRDTRRVARATQIGPLHAMASAAIPILFPPIFIDGAYFCDGGLRQNTPLSPALRLGADKVLVVAVGHGQNADAIGKAPPVAQGPYVAEDYPSATAVLGKVFNALLLDHLDYDLAQLQGFNRLLEDGTQTFGPDFLTQLGRSTERFRGAGYRKIAPLVIRPSRDLGELATEWWLNDRPELGNTANWLLRRLGDEQAAARSDLLSYLGFEGNFARSLIALGMHDADAARSKLIAFFED
jgi:NTE family protein